MSISIRWCMILCSASFVMGLILGIGATKRSTNGSESSCAPTFKESARISTYQGIDVSHHQGSIDWSKVATDTQIQFVYLKATEGATHIDKMYEYNLKKARSVGFRVGSYHYLRKTSSMHQQFMNFTKTAPKDQQDLIPMVDVEEEIAKDSIRLFCQLLTEYYGKRPAIYGTNRSYNKFCAPEFNDYILMIGRYGTNPPIISGTSHYDIWQYSETGVIPGIPKPVDLDRIHPDFDLSNLLME